MKYAFYPGCVSRGGCPELYPAAVKVAERLGIELQELTDVGCTGAGVLSRDISDPINTRTFAKAERLGLPIMTICSTCQGVMSQCNARVQGDVEYLARLNREFLAQEGLEYKGTTEVKHLLWVLVEDFGLEKLKTLVARPLNGLRVSPFYGCYIRRPTDIMTKGFPGRKGYLEDVIKIVGADVQDFGGKTKCCGFPILTANEENSMAMVANHTGEAKEKGADCMVTPCPLCHLNLDGQQPRAEKMKGKQIGLPILHLPQLVGLSLGFSPEEMELKRHFVDTQKVRAKLQMLT
ncbi:MAG: CoB--CoM heterodisulfide reductase iron-sulfur subunit B family protein [Deltaproteobacteria bacterium]|nr:CoB--CoM heterodisulfide reductase iron-sulfur subunit B family protein [Deltaproteobacteria bacterium]MBI3077656.1 CoB--CoM heterodisulfide reductase iron-sulfur subunit B family protein [Deltaproteobacteria bacterium]